MIWQTKVFMKTVKITNSQRNPASNPVTDQSVLWHTKCFTKQSVYLDNLDRLDDANGQCPPTNLFINL